MSPFSMFPLVPPGRVLILWNYALKLAKRKHPAVVRWRGFPVSRRGVNYVLTAGIRLRQ
jgi:hypothetical protein